MANTEWIVAGAEVLLYAAKKTVDGTGPTRTRIKEVDDKSFSLEDSSQYRFNLHDQSSQRVSRLSPWGRMLVVPIDSDTARSVLAEEHSRQLMQVARLVADSWSKYPTRNGRLYAIKALEAVED